MDIIKKKKLRKLKKISRIELVTKEVRSILINEIFMVISEDEYEYISQRTCELLCENNHYKRVNCKNIESVDYKVLSSESISCINPILNNFVSNKILMLFITNRGERFMIEFEKKSVLQNIKKLINFTGFENGENDLCIISRDLDEGIFVARNEYYYDIFFWEH